MARYKVMLLPPALSDLEAVAEFYSGGENVRRVRERMLNDLERLAVFPLYCPAVPCGGLADGGFHMLTEGGVIYIYRLTGEDVSVYHIVASGPSGSVYPALFKDLD